MKDMVSASGIVLRADPQGEYDKRLVILTGELGKITVFVRGARRPASPFLAACNPFVFARFSLYEGRTAYTLGGISGADYFDGIAEKYPGVYYGFYFLELSSYYGQENLEASEMVNLLYAAQKALLREKMPNDLIKAVFEVRMMAVNGDIAPPPDDLSMDPAARYALKYAMQAPIGKLFSFTLAEDALRDFRDFTEKRLTRAAGDRFRTLSVLRTIDG